MPIALEVDASATVSQAQTWGSFDLRVTSPAPAVNTFLATVSRDVVDAYEQPGRSGTYYVRVKLGGEWIPEDELAGPVGIDRNLDAHTWTMEFGLTGRRWSIFATEKTWTRTRVEIHRYLGPSASEMREAETLVGYVLSAQQAHEPEPVLRVRCGSAAVLFERSMVCLEIPPFAGLRRGQIIEAALAAAGLTSFDVPPGAVYLGAVQVADRPLFDWLREFVEPEGWKMRWRGETLELFEPRAKRAPLPADASWTADEWLASQAAPPAAAASTWVLRGTGALIVDEAGLETAMTVTEVVAPYSPKRAVARQSFGPVEDVQPTNLEPAPVADRVISRLVDQRVTRGGQLVKQVTEEYAWHNPSAAKLVTDVDADSYNFLSAYIDADGKLTQWITERFGLISRVVTVPRYDAAGHLTATRIRRYGFRRRTQGVAAHGNPGVTVGSSYVHGDDQSYRERYEVFDLVEEQEITYAYDPESGARRQETQDTYMFYAPKCRVSGPSHGGWYRLYNGTAQTELVAQWRRTERRIRTQILAERDAAVLGDTETRFGFGGPVVRHDGAYDWGGTRSDAEKESFGFLERRSTRYDRVNADQVEVELREPGATPTRRTLLGGRPLPAFLASPWTTLRQQPLEVVVDDATAAAWFGREVRVLQADSVQSTAEALAVIERERRRALAPRLEVTRPVTFAELGDTVAVVDPPSGLVGRALVAGVRETWDMAAAEFTSAYVLEVDR